MRLQVVSENELDELESATHESNGIALHEPEQEESLEESLEAADDTDTSDESTEPEPSESDPADPTSEPAIDPATNPSDDGISPDEMPSREDAPATMEEPVAGASLPPVPQATNPVVNSQSSRWELHVNEIREQDRAVALAENEWNAAKEEAKIKKAAWELAVAGLREVIQRGPEQPSLFGSPTATSPVAQELHSDCTAIPQELHGDTTAEQEADAWMSEPIESLKLSKTVSRRLLKLAVEYDLTTIGRLSDWWQANGGSDLPLGFMLANHIQEVDETLQKYREEVSSSSTAPAPDDDSWKYTPIVELEIVGLSKAIVAKLLDAGITTVGELAAWTTEYRTLADVKGLGPKKVEAVESAMERFWKDRKEQPQ